MVIQAFPGPVPGKRQRPSRTIVAGIGCRSGVAASEIIALIERSLHEAGLPLGNLLAIGTHERKAAEPGLRAAAAHFGIPLRILTGTELEAAAANLPTSQAGLAAVAEAVALTAGELVQGKRKSAGATCALGEVLADFILPRFGRGVQAPSSSAAMASSTSATSLAGP